MSRHNYGNLILFMVVIAFLALSACSGGGGNDNPDGDVQADADTDSENDGDSDDVESDGDKDQAGDTDNEPDGDSESDGDDTDGDQENDGDVESDEEHLSGATLEVEPDPISFDMVELGSSDETIITLRNVQDQEGGQVGLTVSSFNLTTSSSEDISIANGCGAPFTLEAEAEKNCTLVCSPSSPMQKSATLRVVASDGINDPYEQRISVSCGVAYPVSYVDPTMLEFGFTPKGMRQTLHFYVANPASVDLEIAEVRLSDDTPDSYSLSFPDKTLRAETLISNELVEVELSYMPTGNLNEVGLLEIESNDPYVPLRTIPISGRSSFACPSETPNLVGDTCMDECIPLQRACEFDEETETYSYKVCAEDGSEWESAEECDDGLICLDGYCILKACEASALMCRENGVLSCAEDELGFVEEDDCGSSDLCTERSCTPGIGCGEESTSSRCDDSNDCTTDSCHAEEGCRFEFNSDSCEDGNPCTIDDVCKMGSCHGSDISCDDGNVCTSDACDPEAITDIPCVHENLEGSCSDNSACTSGDTCQDGQCLGTEVVCNDGNLCTNDSCNQLSGCVFTPNNIECDDGNACTQDDACFNRVCRGTDIAYNDGNSCNGVEVCNPDSGIVAGTGPSCDDGLACTADTCSDTMNRCEHNPNSSLCDDHNICTTNICSTSSGCIYQQVANGSPCDYLPGVDEVCYEGLCSHSCTKHSDCDDGLDCTEDNCDFSAGLCRNVTRDDACQDGSICNGEEICNPVIGCTGGELLMCDDGVSCTSDYCDEDAGGCVHVTANSLCNDYNICTVDVCNPSEGCQYIAVNIGCDDKNACTLGDHCFNGVCTSGSNILDCDDDDICTSDVCDPKSGCLHSDNAAACDDGDPCTDGSYCKDGVCAVGIDDCDDGIFCNGQEICAYNGTCSEPPAPDCDDRIVCTHDECDAGSDSCLHSPVNEDCDDDNPCTTEYCDVENGCVYEEVEDGILCQGGYCYQGLCASPCSTDDNCNDGLECTSDVCDTEVGLCTHGVNNEACRNSIYCDGEEYCDVLKGCMSGTPVNCEDGLVCTYNYCMEDGCQTELTDYCNDGNDCTEDVCDETLNPLILPNGCLYNKLTETECSDGNSCTIDDVCTEGVCAGSPKSCNDDNPCTVDTCDLDGECQPVQMTNGTNCGEGLVCLWGICVDGCSTDDDCIGADDIDCTIEICSPEAFQCISIAIDEICDNGLYCDGAEYCDETQGCLSGTPIECNDGVNCTVDSCNEQISACQYKPDNSVCNDNDPCVEGYCSTSSDCVYGYTDYLCSDGNPCTVDDRCNDGECEGSLLADACNDDNACTADSCDPEAGCLHVDISDQCDDDNVCTMDYCSPAYGCMHPTVESMACSDNSACTEMEYCENGVCTGFTKVDCEDNNPCTSDSCSPLGGCVNSYNGEGSQCDLGLMIEGETCRGGICTTACDDSSDCDDLIDCTLDACQAGYCTHLPQNGICSDGVFCNGVETCIPNYGCQVGLTPSCNDSVECTRDWCDTELDECVNQYTNEICDDGNPCTSDACSAAGCDNEPLDDINCDDGNLCTVSDMCDSGVCSGEELACDDYNDCTGPDTCDPDSGCRFPVVQDEVDCGEQGAGMICMGGTCTAACDYDFQCDDGVDCTRDSCDKSSHICRYTSQNLLCDDGIFCNGSETCHATLGCIDANTNPCDDLLFCTDDSCDEENDACSNVEVNSRCEDFNDCTSDSCEVGLGCKYSINSGAACNDGDPCTAVSKCSSSGQCAGSTLTDCTTGDNCRPGTCEAGLGCVEDIRPDGSPCEISDSCSRSAQCISGQCVTSEYLFCDDNNECTTNGCSGSGCAYYAIIQPVSCEDGLRCTTSEYCYANQCNSAPVSCDDGNICTSDSCSEENGCSHAPANEGQSCFAPAGKTPSSVCREGACVNTCSGAGDCDDSIDCTTDSCDGGTCRHTPQHTMCDDGLYCNGQELCLIGQGCVDNIPIECGDKVECTSDSCNEAADSCINDAAASNCDDNNPCTLDACDLSLGCTHQILDGIACDDGDACSLGGVCVEGFCASKQTIHCDDGNPCTKDLCNAASGCEFEPITGLDCSDGNVCTIMDTCSTGKCQGIEAVCDDHNQCTFDYCEASVGCINQPLTAVECDDGNAYTSEDYCFKGQCNGYEIIE